MVIVFKNGNTLQFDLSSVEIYVTIGLLVAKVGDDFEFHEYDLNEISCIVPLSELKEQ